MNKEGELTHGLEGMYRDILRGEGGKVLWKSRWQKNTIVADCRRLLAGFMRGAPITLGIQGIMLGAGLDTWDSPPGPPTPSTGQAALVDPAAFTIPYVDPPPAVLPPSTIQIDYLLDDADVITATPTNRIQIVAIVGPGNPPWPDGAHPTSTLREFGLFGHINGADVLINYVTHPAIAKDPTSTLERTIWLVF